MKTHARLLTGALLALLCVGSPPAVAAQELPLRGHAERRSFYVGAAVAVRPLKNDPLYLETLRREFNIVVAENAF